MIPARPVAQGAAFAGAAERRRLRIVTQPADARCLGTVIWVHAFAEELNKTRRMSARMARLLAGEGWRVVQKDLSGCGDSTGDFGDATWAAWVDDVKAELLQAASFYFAHKLKPVVHTVLPLAEARRAHEMMEASQHFGKIVLQVA